MEGGGVILEHGVGGIISRPLVSCWSLARLQEEPGFPCGFPPVPAICGVGVGAGVGVGVGVGIGPGVCEWG